MQKKTVAIAALAGLLAGCSGGAVIVDEDGNQRFGDAGSEALPGDVQQYPDSRNHQLVSRAAATDQPNAQSTTILTFASDDSVEDVLGFYQDTLGEAGYEVSDVLDAGDGYLAIRADRGEGESVRITGWRADDETSVSLTHMATPSATAD